MKQELQEAINIIREACKSISANYNTHVAVQEAVDLVSRELNKSNSPPKK